jgi:hypothetical protein
VFSFYGLSTSNTFQAGMADQLDLVLTGLLVEVEDSFADGVSLVCVGVVELHESPKYVFLS